MGGGNFCSVTGQPNWCGSMMGCDGSAGQCPVQHWCVCQWAFASYLQRAGGCDKIQNIVCDATNMVAITAYRAQAASNPPICISPMLWGSETIWLSLRYRSRPI